jgi:hypothetical protein
MVAFYVALALIALITAVGVFLFARLLSKHPAKRLIGVWICIATSVAMFLLYTLEGERNSFMLAGGLTAFLFGAVALIGATVKRSN